MKREALRLEKNSGNRLSKIESNPADLARLKEGPESSLAVTIKVAKPGYVPSFVNVRAQISSNLFTATVTEKDLHQLEADPMVVSLGTPKRLHPVT